MEFTDMQGICVGGSAHVTLLGRGMLGNVLVNTLGATGMDVITIHGGCAGSAVVYHTAFLEVASGRKDIVLAVGADKVPRGLTGYRWTMGTPDLNTDRQYLKMKATGMNNPACWAMMCRRRMIEYGTTEEHLAKVAVKAHKNGALNPYARYKKVFTIEEILASTMIADPLRVLELCAFSHGAGAAIFCSVEKAKQLTTKPVFVAATAMSSEEYGEPLLETVSLSMAVNPSARHASCRAGSVWEAYEEAGIGPE
ncbi:unnamed protein product, partial [marine sediment metagenome]